MGVRVPPGRPAFQHGLDARRSSSRPLSGQLGFDSPRVHEDIHRSGPMEGRRALNPSMQVRSLPSVLRAPSGRDRPTLAFQAGSAPASLRRLLSSPRRGGAGTPADTLVPCSARSGRRARRRPPALDSPLRGARAGGAAPRGPRAHGSMTTEKRYGRGRTRVPCKRGAPAPPICRCSSKEERAPVKRLTVVRSHPPTPFAPMAQRKSSCPVSRRLRFDSGWGLHGPFV